MANDVNCRIRIFGNATVMATVKEIQERFLAREKTKKIFKDTTAVGVILFGNSETSDENSYDQIGVKWVYANDLESDGELGFVSAWSPVIGLQDHIQSHLAKIDPQVVMVMNYDDEGPEFFGARLTLMNNGELVAFEDEIDTSGYAFASEDEVEEEQHRLDEENSDNSIEVVSWSELADYKTQCENRVIENAREKFPWISKIFFKKGKC